MANYGYEELSSAFSVQTVHLCVPLPHPDKQIRVLDLDQVHSGSPITSRLHGRLRVLHEPGNQEYSALSYVWAQEDPGTLQRDNRLIIHCDGHQHEARISPNCWSALWHLSINGPLTIWVDAICIDQENNAEKIPQISLMRNIYTLAQTTYFWLGEAASGTNEAMDYLLRDETLISMGEVKDTVLIALNISCRILTFQTHPHRSGLKEIFSRQWIQRLWTLQECLMSKNGIVMCGGKSIPWLDLVCALESIHYFHTHRWSLQFDDLYLPWLNLANLTRWFAENQQLGLNQISGNLDRPDPRVQAHLLCLKWSVRVVLITFAVFYISVIFSFCWPLLFWLPFVPPFSIFRRSAGKKTRLFFPITQHSILEELRSREVGNPKDMYNGMVGILGDDPSDTEDGLHVVYRKLCTSLIRRTRSLDVLLFTNTCADNNYCSWVINWNTTTPQLWGKALHYMDKRTIRDIIFWAWDIDIYREAMLGDIWRSYKAGIKAGIKAFKGMNCFTDLYQVFFLTIDRLHSFCVLLFQARGSEKTPGGNARNTSADGVW